MHELLVDTKGEMIFNNYNYQSAAESHKRLQKLAISDKVLIRVHPERLSLAMLHEHGNIEMDMTRGHATNS